MKIVKSWFKVMAASIILMVGLNVNGQKSKIKSKEKSAIEKSLSEKSEENSDKEVEISKEVDAVKGSTVRIISSNHNVEIRRGTDNKVKLSTKIWVEKSNKLTNDELMEKFGISFRALNNRIDIAARENGNGNFFFTYPNDQMQRKMEFNYQYNIPGTENMQRENLNKLKKQQAEIEIRSQRDKMRIEQQLIKVKKQAESMAKQFKERGEFERLRDQQPIREGKIPPSDIGQLEQLKVLEDPKTWEGLKNMAVTIPKLNGMKLYGPNMNFNLDSHSANKSTLVVYVPSDVKLEIENKYGNINIGDNYKEASLNITNGSLDARKIADLKLISKYSSVNIGDVDDAEIEVENGNFTAGNIKQLDIDSKYSTIEYDNGTNMIIRSQNDNYIVESLDNLQGRKSYGSFRLNKLVKSFDLDGQNADLRIKNMMRGVEKVKLNDRYADIRLPVKELQNYAVNFEGNYSTVYGPFEKHVPEVSAADKKEIENNKNTSENTIYFVNGNEYKNRSGEKAPPIFSASVGDIKGPHTQFNIICNQCTVDFK